MPARTRRAAGEVEELLPARPALRADARRNRERIIAAAREVFAQRGLDVPVEDIARHAGVGVATLYRRFPTRADLIAGAFEAKMAAYADAVTQALADPDPWAGFCSYIEQVCAMQAADQGFAGPATRLRGRLLPAGRWPGCPRRSPQPWWSFCMGHWPPARTGWASRSGSGWRVCTAPAAAITG